MTSNAHAKTAGSKNRFKPSAPKNSFKAPATKDLNPLNYHINPLKSSETASLQQPAGKPTSVTALADQELSTEKAPQDNADEVSSGVGVNKKKQKRRQKEAARKAAEQPPMTSQLAQDFANVSDSAYQDIVKEMAAAQAGKETNGYGYEGSDYDDPEQYGLQEEDGVYYGDDANLQYQNSHAPRTNGHDLHDYIPQEALSGKAKKKKKSKPNPTSRDAYSLVNPSLATQTSYQPTPPPPPPHLDQHIPPGLHRPPHNESKDRIWNTSTVEERERIKEFWLSLGEEDRRSLVKVEKEAVLKKMKEQQKHSCSCTVCGRKRTAIEEELEVLYDAYYEELEVYANPNHGTSMAAQARMYAHPMARMPPGRNPQMQSRRFSRGRIQELGEDDDAGDEEDYSDEEDEEDLSEEEIGEQPMRPATDFFNFGKSLTVQGGILTVADDLLKNDGKKFIEMMEQLAERRMQREEDQYARAGLGHSPIPGHNHNQPPDDDGYDDEEEDDDAEYDEDDEEFDEEDDMESMTESQRMEEGRRMFQIFAARMFEQRVLTAYREKVALERQRKLLEELDDETRVDAQREAKKAKEAQKKKDKKRQQKQAKDEEKAKRDAEKAAEEAAAKALEEKKAEELRQRKEEQRRKREAEKKTQEEEKQRKEAEKQRRLQEAKEQQADLERKQREQKDREKKKREEIKKKEREEREVKEMEIREKKEHDAVKRRDLEVKTKADSEAKERIKHDAQHAPKRQSPANASSAPMPPGLHPPLTSSSHTSPRLQIATPVVPKAPTPVRPRQLSFQEPHNVSPKTSQPASSSVTTSPSVSSGQPNGATGLPIKSTIQPTPTQTPQTPSRYSPVGVSPSQPVYPPGFPSMPTVSGTVYNSSFGPPLSPTAQQAPPSSVIYSNQPPIGSAPYRNFAAPNGLSFPTSINGTNQMPQGRGGMMGPPLQPISTGGIPSGNATDVGRYGMSRDNIPSQSHSRNTSASYDRSTFDTSGVLAPTQPIARPAPIKRPSSVAPHQQGENFRPSNAEVEDLSNHLGSSALLDDTDVPFNSHLNESRRGSMAPGAPRNMGQAFGAHSGFSNPMGSARTDNFPRGMQTGNGNAWPAQQSPFGAPQMSGPPQWSNAPGFGRANNNNGFGSIGGPSRPTGSRAVTIRIMVRTACEKLTARAPINQNIGWHRAEDVLREVQLMKPAHELPVHMREMLEISDTEGNGQNGGGSFLTQAEEQVGLLIKFESGRNTSLSGRGAGDIGSPIVGGGAIPAIGGQRPFQQPGGF